MDLPDFLTRENDGEVHLTGHRIGLYTVARLHKEGWSAERIAAELPSLPLAVITKVLGFCQANQAEVDAYLEAYRTELDRQANAPAGLGVLKVRKQMEDLSEADAKYGSDPGWADLSVVEKLRRLEGAKLRQTV